MIRTFGPAGFPGFLKEHMTDFLYIALTLFVFGALVAYVRACALLGREDNTDLRRKDER